MTKKQRAELAVKALEHEYPEPNPGLDYSEEDAWQLLVAVRLAAQCTDARVNLVTPALFANYPSPKALGDADIKDIEAMVYTCGLGATKARDIKACMRMLDDEFGGRVPDTMEQLLKLPGVGRKSANLVLGDIYGKPAIVCDTHCIRICNRLGLIDTKNPTVAEKQLRQIIEPEKGNDFCHRLVLHGRAVCTARGFDCGRCCLHQYCPTPKLDNTTI
jgi:endonuclease-3